MLAPHDRIGLLDALRPPQGFRLDRAVGTSFTLDLESALAVPLAFAAYEVESEVVRDDEPAGLLEAVLRTAGRVTVFSQEGYISVPRDPRRVYAWLEDMVVPIRPPSGGAIFHPKVWVARYVHEDSGERRVRLACATRNLTFDTSWDTVLVTDADPGARHAEPNAQPIADLLDRLAPRAPRAKAIAALGDELRTLRFPAPTPFASLRFAWLPVERLEHLLPDRADRVAVVSPYLDASTVRRILDLGGETTIVSRPSTLDDVGPAACQGASAFVLEPGAVADVEPDDDDGDRRRAPRHGHLHAKLHVIDHGRMTTVVTGSANATSAGWGGNDEVVAVLGGRVEAGVEALLGTDGPGLAYKGTRRVDRFGSLLAPHVFETPDADAEPADELAADHDLRLRLGGLALMARTTALGEGQVEVHVTSSGAFRPPPGDALVTLRPLTLEPTAARALIAGVPVDEVWEVALLDLTAFFVLAASNAAAGPPTDVLVKADLVDPPAERDRTVLASLLGSGKLRAYLQALLGMQPDPQRPGSAALSLTGAGGGAATGGVPDRPFLEPLLAALARRDKGLESFAALVEDLGDGAEEGLGPELFALWQLVDRVRQGRP